LKNKLALTGWSRGIFLAILTCLFLIAPLCTAPSIGGLGLALPYNIPVWAVASWIMAIASILITVNKQFITPRLWVTFVIFPIIILIISLFYPVNQPITWLFRQLYIMGGVLFLFALFQFQAKQAAIDRVLFILVLAMGLHACLGTLQIVVPDRIPWLSFTHNYVPQGIFQQINVQATFLVTGVILTLYLISRPCFRFSSLIIKVWVVVAFALAVYIVIASGSRIGLLSLLLGVPLILWSRYRQLWWHKKLLIVLLLVSCGSFWAGQAGLYRTLDKTAQLSENSYSSARITMYAIGMELVAKSPIYGYGIGGFLKAWNKQASDFMTRHSETVLLPEHITHPHNELLLWMIEAGLPAVIGIFAMIAGMGLALYRCGFQRGGAYAAMLLPISLHTQVELPFYVSSVHWFLWLFLIYLLLRHQTKTIKTHLSQSAIWLIRVTAVFFAIGITIFMNNTARAQADLYHYVYDTNTQPPYLQIALNNLYFEHLAEQVAMHSMLYISIANHDRTKVETFENWAKEYVKIKPELVIYQDLILASQFLRPKDKGCDAIKAGFAMYAQNKVLQQAVIHCQKTASKKQ